MAEESVSPEAAAPNTIERKPAKRTKQPKSAKSEWNRAELEFLPASTLNAA